MKKNNLSIKIFFMLFLFALFNALNYLLTNNLDFYNDYIFYCIPFFIFYLFYSKDHIEKTHVFIIFSLFISITAYNLSLFYFQIYFISIVINLMFLIILYLFIKKIKNKKYLIFVFLTYLPVSIYLIINIFSYIIIKKSDILFYYIIVLYYQTSFTIYFFHLILKKIHLINNENSIIQSLISPFLIFFKIFKK
jgi:hypothetical protein